MHEAGLIGLFPMPISCVLGHIHYSAWWHPTNQPMIFICSWLAKNSAQQVPEPDQLPSIFFNTQPNPIQFSKIMGSR